MTADPRATLAAIRARADAATEGPWEVGDRYHIQGADHCRCRPSNGPLVWEGTRDINGTRMRTHIHRRPESLGGEGSDTSIYGGTLPEPTTVALSTDEYVEIAPEDAEFIAAARTDIPALLAFAEAVLDLADPDYPPPPPDERGAAGWRFAMEHIRALAREHLTKEGQ